MADPMLSAAEAAVWLMSDPADAALLPLVIDAATQALIDMMNGDPRTTDYEEWRNGTGGASQPLNRAPVQRVRKVLLDGVPLDMADITWDDCILYRKAGFPRGNRNLKVFYSAGYDDLPPPVRQACLYTVKAMWLARRVDQNATGESFAGVLSQSFWQTGPGTVPPAARDLCRNYIARFFTA